jgi:predicted HicB family RNase H-like nuclease
LIDELIRMKLFVIEMRDFVAMLVPAESASAEPEKPPKRARTNLTASVLTELASRVREWAKAESVSVSEWITSLITEHLPNV